MHGGNIPKSAVPRERVSHGARVPNALARCYAMQVPPQCRRCRSAPAHGRSRRRRGPRVLASLAFAGTALVATSAMASGLNIEKLRIGRPEDGIHANVDASFAYGQGNVTLIDLGTDGSFAYRKDRHLVFLLGASNFSTRARNEDGDGVGQIIDADNVFVDRHYAHLRYNYRFLRWVTLEVFTQLQTDEFLLVQVRTKHGAGPRFTPYQNSAFGIHLGVQYMFDHEQLDPDRLLVAPRGSARSFAHRNSSYFTMSLDVDRFTAQTTTYVQPRLDGPRDVQILHEAEFSIDITKYFAFKLGMNLRWDSRPPIYCAERLGPDGACPAGDIVNVRHYDLAFRNSLSFSF